MRVPVQIFACFCLSCAFCVPSPRHQHLSPTTVNPINFPPRNGQFAIDGQPIEIIAGEIHPSRIPYQFWEDRIKKARAMGLNTVSVYIFWNQLEPAEGKFNWQGANDIRRFVKLCQDNGLWVAPPPRPVCLRRNRVRRLPGLASQTSRHQSSAPMIPSS